MDVFITPTLSVKFPFGTHILCKFKSDPTTIFYRIKLVDKFKLYELAAEPDHFFEMTEPCEGCRLNAPGQKDHMDWPSGCLCPDFI